MSNRAIITSLGENAVCIQDDFGQEIISVQNVGHDPFVLFETVCAVVSGEGADILSWVRKQQKGVLINDVWFDWEEISGCFSR
jgi:hypothetical protein